MSKEDYIWLLYFGKLCNVSEIGKNLTEGDILVLPMDVVAVQKHSEHFQQVISHFGQVHFYQVVITKRQWLMIHNHPVIYHWQSMQLMQYHQVINVLCFSWMFLLIMLADHREPTGKTLTWLSTRRCSVSTCLGFCPCLV